MRVLYFHPSIDLHTPAYGVIPVGAFAICGGLKKEQHEVQMINVGLELLQNPQYQIQKDLQCFRPDVVLIELHWYVHARGAIDLVQAVKAWNPDIPVIVGGITASIFPREILSRFRGVDFIITGDAERPVFQLLREMERSQPQWESIPNLWWRSHGQIQVSPLRHREHTLDDFSYTDYALLKNWDLYTRVSKVPQMAFQDFRQRDFWLCNGRGCVFECDFCGGGKKAQQEVYGRQGIITRSPEKLLKDIEIVSQGAGVNQICLSYDLALMKKPYYSHIFDQWREKKWELGLYNECWQLPSHAFVEDFCRSVVPSLSALVFSPISGAESIRQRNGKHFTNDRLLKLLKYLANHQIPVQLFFNFNAWGQDSRDFVETVRLCRQIADFYPPGLIRFMCQDVMPEPLSPREGRIQSLRFEDYYLNRVALQDEQDSDRWRKERLWQEFIQGYTSQYSSLFQEFNHSFLKQPVS